MGTTGQTSANLRLKGNISHDQTPQVIASTSKEESSEHSRIGSAKRPRSRKSSAVNTPAQRVSSAQYDQINKTATQLREHNEELEQRNMQTEVRIQELEQLLVEKNEEIESVNGLYNL